MSILFGDHSGNLDKPWSCPEVAMTNLTDKVGHHLLSWLLESGRPPQDLSHGRGREAHLCPMFGGGRVGRGRHKTINSTSPSFLPSAFKSLTCPTEAVSLQKKV